MQPSSHPGGVIRFGPFEADLDNGVLRKHGVRIKLQAQPFTILAALLESPGSVVTREDLRARLWPDDTFVDFEHGLNAAVTRLRHALGDSAEHPVYIETLAKRGYRFLAEAEPSRTAIAAEAMPAQVAAPKQRFAFWLSLGIFFLLAAMGLMRWHLSGGSDRVWRAVPLTTFPGYEDHPALSPDGNTIAFIWNGESERNFNIYVMPIASGTPTRLTTNPADDMSPAWSPDGRRIAFVRRLDSEHGELLVIPASGGPEHKVADLRNYELRLSPPRLMSVAWSLQGQFLVTSHREPGDTSEALYAFSLSGEKRRLTSPPPGYAGDHMPVLSPDGRALAFCRQAGLSASDIYVMGVDLSRGQATVARPLTQHSRWSANPVWTRDGTGILYLLAQTPDSPSELRVKPASGHGAAERSVVIDDKATRITAGRHLVYSQPFEDTNIWRSAIAAPGSPPSRPALFINSTRCDGMAQYSPDGKKIVFVSCRSGSTELWLCRADGSQPYRLTSFGGPLVGMPNWSPDGQWIVFHARPQGQADVFVIPAAGGAPKPVTTDAADDVAATYSHDGHWIYFCSSRSGDWQIWKIPAGGGPAIQVTKEGGWRRSVVSPDGRWIYFYRVGDNGIWRVPTEGGTEERVTAPVHDWPVGFAVTSDGIYYPAPPNAGGDRYIRFFSLATRQSRAISLTSHSVRLGFTVSPDRRYILFDQIDRFGSDLMLIRDFQP